MKRALDVMIAAAALTITAPVLLLMTLLIWLQDLKNPIYVSLRVRNRRSTFRMYKFRSMVPNADLIGGTSTSADDRRITPMGRVARAFKIDELPQFWNVLIGDMSLVGPRPQVVQDASRYTREENHLFDVRSGITDFASIVFADESDILEGAVDPDARYDAVIRPWKSRLGLFYVRNHSLAIDLQLAVLTAVGIFSRPVALRGIQRILRRLKADPELIEVAGRTGPPEPAAPPGAGVPGINGPFLPESVFERAAWLQALNRIRRGPVVIAQLLIVIASNVAAWMLRFDGQLADAQIQVIRESLIILVGIRAICFAPFGLYQGLWRYSGIYDLKALLGGILTSSLVFYAWIAVRYPPDRYSRSIIFVDALLLVFLLGAVRMSRRVYSEFTSTQRAGLRVLVYGAGDSGELVLRDMRQRRDSGRIAVGLIDDNFSKLGLRIHGVPVLGGRRNLLEIAARIKPDELVLAIPSLRFADIEAISQLASRLDLPVRNLSNSPIAAAKVDVSSKVPMMRASTRTRGSYELAQACPKCHERHLNRSKARNFVERFRRRLSSKRLFRCSSCGWRGWLEMIVLSGGTSAADHREGFELDPISSSTTIAAVPVEVRGIPSGDGE